MVAKFIYRATRTVPEHVESDIDHHMRSPHSGIRANQNSAYKPRLMSKRGIDVEHPTFYSHQTYLSYVHMHMKTCRCGLEKRLQARAKPRLCCYHSSRIAWSTCPRLWSEFWSTRIRCVLRCSSKVRAKASANMDR